MVTWAIQTNFIAQHNSDRMAHAIRHSGGVPLSVQLSSFDDSLTFNLSDPPLDNFVIPYGSTKLIRLGIERGWLGCFFNDNFDVVKWNANRNDMLNFDSAIVAAKDIPVWLADYPPDVPMFVRPCYDTKAITGVVQRVDYIISWMANIPTGTRITPETLIAITPKKHIEIEWRWFVVGGKVIDGSTYKIRGQTIQLHVDDPVEISEAQKFADKWLPHETCVMDLAKTDNGMKCIEFNCLNSSGLYQHDVRKIVEAVNSYVKIRV